MLPLQSPFLRASVELQNTHSPSGQVEAALLVSAVRGVTPTKRLAGVVRSVRMKSGLDQAAELRTLVQLASPPMPSQTSLRRSAAAILEAEKRKGIPKLDSAWILAPLELTKDGGGEH